MKPLVVLRIDLGVATVEGVGGRELLTAAGELVMRNAGHVAGRFELAKNDAWLKSDAVVERARLRMSVGRWFGAEPASRVEHKNFAWLREHGFRAPEPLAAGIVLDGNTVQRQFVATRWLGELQNLEEHLRTASGPDRRARLDALARDVARLHALGFVHRDLYLRNLLVDDDPHCVVLDCRRGGRARPMRDASYDLGCLMLEGAGLFSRDEQSEFFTRYFAERAAHAVPAERATTLAAADRARDGLLERIAHAPQRWRAKEPPVERWAWRELSS